MSVHYCYQSFKKYKEFLTSARLQRDTINATSIVSNGIFCNVKNCITLQSRLKSLLLSMLLW